MVFHSDFEHLPVLGAGIGLRKQHFHELKTTQLPVGWLEIVPENFMNFGGFPRRYWIYAPAAGPSSLMV